jgi:signal transduction histidine kinase
VLERDSVLLFRYPERHYDYPARVDPPIAEALLIPFHYEGKPVGTIWVIAHDEGRKFDAEDARLMEDLSKFASSAYQVLHSLEGMQEQMAECERSQRVLQESEERFRTLVEACSEVFYRMSPDWGEMRQLRSQHFLVETETPSRNWIDRYIPQEEQFLVTQTFKKAIASRSPFELEHRVFRADGGLSWVSSRAVPLLDDKGEIVEWFGAATDITERKNAQESLICAEKLAATGRLAATLAHEVNNPLAGATNALFLASNDPELKAETREYLRVAEQELRRAAYITRQSLGFYRENGSHEPVPLPLLIDDVIRVYTGKLQDRNITVLRKYRYGRCTHGERCLMVNAGELRQMISNLLANGIDALNDNGTVYIRASRTSNAGVEQIHLTIADNGGGIRVGNLKRIFEPFFTTKENYGTGLGLWVTKELVRKHNGSIKVRSREGQGTVFRISLPATA